MRVKVTDKTRPDSPEPQVVVRPSAHKGDTLQTWEVDNMRAAYYEYERQHAPDFRGRPQGYKVIAKAYGLPAETFRKRLVGPLRGIFIKLSGGKGQPRIFTKDQETELSSHISSFAQAGFPFTRREIRFLAYEYAEANNIQGFNECTREVGKHWMELFMERHEELTLKKPKLLSIYRAKSVTRTVINTWFELYKDLMWEHGIHSPTQCWNFDETGAIDCNRSQSVVGVTGEKTHQLTPSEKGVTTSVVTYVNAAGLRTKPMIIHRGQRVQDVWRTGMPFGYCLACSDNGWINKKLCYEYGKVFIDYLHSRGLLNNGMRHLLLMDGHKSHTFNYPFIKLLHENNVIVLCLPPHTSHAIQPLDNVPYAQFKVRWFDLLRIHVREKSAKRLTKAEWFSVFCPAWSHAMTVKNIRKGFQLTGMWPPNPNMIKDDKFGPSKILNRECEVRLMCVSVVFLILGVTLLSCKSPLFDIYNIIRTFSTCI